MIRCLVLSTLIGLASLLLGPAHAQKAVIQPDVESLVKAQAPESVKTALRSDAGVRRGAAATPAKTTPEKDPDRENLRMLVVALLLMLAIAIRRNRSDPR